MTASTNPAPAKTEKVLTATYKGPSQHRRVISTKDVKTNHTIDDAVVLEEDLVWEAGADRRPVSLKGVPDEIVEILRNDSDFTVSEKEVEVKASTGQNG